MSWNFRITWEEGSSADMYRNIEICSTLVSASVEYSTTSTLYWAKIFLGDEEKRPLENRELGSGVSSLLF
jgi:hypothetical protein